VTTDWESKMASLGPSRIASGLPERLPLLGGCPVASATYLEPDARHAARFQLPERRSRQAAAMDWGPNKRAWVRARAPMVVGLGIGQPGRDGQGGGWGGQASGDEPPSGGVQDWPGRARGGNSAGPGLCDMSRPSHCCLPRSGLAGPLPSACLGPLLRASTIVCSMPLSACPLHVLCTFPPFVFVIRHACHHR
jgi:hypothetical protein